MTMSKSLSKGVKRFSHDETFREISSPEDSRDVSSIPEISLDVTVSHSPDFSGITKEEMIHVGLNKEPKPSIEANSFESYSDRLRPLFNKVYNLVPAFGSDSTDAKFFSETISSTPGKTVFMQVNANESFSSVVHETVIYHDRASFIF